MRVGARSKSETPRVEARGLLHTAMKEVDPEGMIFEWEMIYKILFIDRGQCTNLRAKRLP